MRVEVSKRNNSIISDCECQKISKVIKDCFSGHFLMSICSGGHLIKFECISEN